MSSIASARSIIDVGSVDAELTLSAPDGRATTITVVAAAYDAEVLFSFFSARYMLEEVSIVADRAEIQRVLALELRAHVDGISEVA